MVASSLLHTTFILHLRRLIFFPKLKKLLILTLGIPLMVLIIDYLLLSILLIQHSALGRYLDDYGDIYIFSIILVLTNLFVLLFL